MSSALNYDCIIIGAGWAGLSAAIALTRAGQSILLLEAAPKAGGRARTISFGDKQVDNGQHLLLGAYKHVRLVLDWLGMSESHAFQIKPFYLNMMGNYQLKFPSLPHPFNAVIGVMFSSLSFTEKKSLCYFFYLLKNKKIHLKTDCSIKQLLENYKQPKTLIQKFWEPIALAALSTPMDKASSQVFLSVLEKSFSLENHFSSHYYLPKLDLSKLFVEPAIHYLTNKQQTIHFAERALMIDYLGKQPIAVKTSHHTYDTKSVIIAAPPNIACNLLPTHPLLTTLKEQLTQFTYQPITTVYLHFNRPIHLPQSMIGLINHTAHWWFDRQITGQPNILAAVMSGEGIHDSLSVASLAEIILQELKQHIPTCPELIDYRVIREKRGAFSCEVGIENIRPNFQTPLSGIWLAGDYTNTHLPATLESAVQSGLQCASEILDC